MFINIRFPKKYLIALLAIPLLSACNAADDMAYDESDYNYGENAPMNTPHNIRKHVHSYGLMDDQRSGSRYYPHRGYYDYNGYYIPRNSGLKIPRDMFPARGMCRIWFVGRMVADQPDIESCDGIKSRVPVGAYVVYGG